MAQFLVRKKRTCVVDLKVQCLCVFRQQRDVRVNDRSLSGEEFCWVLSVTSNRHTPMFWYRIRH